MACGDAVNLACGNQFPVEPVPDVTGGLFKVIVDSRYIGGPGKKR